MPKTWQPRTGPTEAEFLGMVIQLAKLRGWLVMHQRPAVNRRGKWATAIQGDAGFPDLVMVKKYPGRLLVAELKVGRGELTAGQAIWLATFREAGVAAYCWRPEDWPEIERVLQ